MKTEKKREIRVLVVDDSALLRKIIGDIVREQPDMELAGTAFNGEDALHKIKLYSPDVITMDLEMPRLDGISTLQKIMAEDPLPVIIISSYTQQGSEKTMEALACGAVDFAAKPLSGRRDETIGSLKAILPEKIRAAAVARLSPLVKKQTTTVSSPAGAKPIKDKEASAVVAIGASTGGPRALEEIIRQFPADLPAAVLITQHMPAGFTTSLANRLDRISSISVKEARQDDHLLEGVALVAPGDYHIRVSNNRIVLDKGPKVNHVRPAIDVMIESLAGLPYNVVAVILTGMGRDGLVGVKTLKQGKNETVILVQDPETAVVKGMPEAVIKGGYSDAVVQLPGISTQIMYWLQKLKEDKALR